MREIKFRAWSKKRKRMYEVLHLHIATSTNNGVWATVKGYNVIDDKDIHIQVQPEDIEIMQYTGLKDRNGKEIYEGDVVKGHWWSNGKMHRHIGKVAYVINAYKVRGVKQYEGIDDDLNSTYTVIGNTYENPELLGNEKQL